MDTTWEVLWAPSPEDWLRLSHLAPGMCPALCRAAGTQLRAKQTDLPAVMDPPSSGGPCSVTG